MDWENCPRPRPRPRRIVLGLKCLSYFEHHWIVQFWGAVWTRAMTSQSLTNCSNVHCNHVESMVVNSIESCWRDDEEGLRVSMSETAGDCWWGTVASDLRGSGRQAQWACSRSAATSSASAALGEEASRARISATRTTVVSDVTNRRAMPPWALFYKLSPYSTWTPKSLSFRDI